MPAAAAAAADTTPAAVPTTNEKEGEDSGSEDEQALMEELWPRETQPELQYEIALPSGHGALPLPITQDLMGRRFPYQIGNIVWDAAVAMHHFFQDRAQFPLGCFQGQSVLELGSGTGLVGITLAMLGARVVLTDLPDALDILRHNVDRCFTPEALATLRAALPFDIHVPTVEPLTWGEPVPPERRRRYDLVVGSDITYNKAAIKDLLRTLGEVTAYNNSSSADADADGGGDAPCQMAAAAAPACAAEVYVGHLERGDEPEFFEALDRDWGFAVREVHREDVAEGGIARKLIVHVFHAKKREEENGAAAAAVEGEQGE